LIRKLKLFSIYLFSSILFTLNIKNILLLLNPFIKIDNETNFNLSTELFIYFGIIWFLISLILFIIIQFFSEKKLSIGFISPPTLVYFLSFTVLINSIILYLNYTFYYDFISKSIKTLFIKILLINLIVIILGISFIFSSKKNKIFLSISLLLILSLSVFFSEYNIINNRRTNYFTNFTPKVNNEPRKLRIIIMNGLSLNLIESIASEQKLRNFNFLINNGVRAKFKTFKPNPKVSLLNSFFTGLKPYQFKPHYDYKFQFKSIEQEFDISPKYVLFRNYAKLNLISLYKRSKNFLLNNIEKFFKINNYKTYNLLNSDFKPIYSEKSLKTNNKFIYLFSQAIKENTKKIKILKKSFFYDEVIRNLIPELKKSDLYLTIINLPGLEKITKYFYQYYFSKIFENINETKKYNWILENYYEYYDSIVGNLISTTGNDEMLIIISFFEYKPLPVWRRVIINTLNKKGIYVYIPLKSQGSVFIYEKNAIKKNYPLQNVNIYDLYATLLYYSGFQLSRNLNGKILKNAFLEEFLLNNPIFIQGNIQP